MGNYKQKGSLFFGYGNSHSKGKGGPKFIDKIMGFAKGLTGGGAAQYSSPAKQHTEYSEKIGPAQDPEKIKKARKSAANVPMGKEHDAEYDVKQAKYEKMKEFQK